MIAILSLGVCLVYVGWTLSCLEVNVRKARALGIPVVRTPFDVDGHLWVVVQPLVWKFLACFPLPWSSYPDIIRFSHRNWNFLEKSGPTARFGPVWALVSPGGVHLQFADPAAIEDIFRRWTEFVRPIHKYKILAIFGPSLFNVSTEEYPRHRKAVAAPFNESIMSSAWQETIRQSRSMADYWSSQSAAGIPDLLRDTRTVTLNVLASTVFGETSDFIGSANLEKRTLSPARSFRDAVLLVHHYIIHLMVIPYRYLMMPFLPSGLRRIGYAAHCLKTSMEKAVTEERAALQDGKSSSGGLTTSLARAIDNKSDKAALSVDETLGNIFMINFAGLDSTANVLAFMTMRLAGEPDVQDWLHEEIVSITQGRPVQDCEYSLFPRFKRCFAVLLETMRLYPPATGLPKMTSKGVHTIQVGERSIAIPPGVDVFPVLLGMQTDPRYWPDPLIWKPSRWILRSDTITGVEGEELFVPQKGTFFPWSEGTQNCLGKKLSQVEAVAVLVSLLMTHRMQVKAQPDETRDRIRKRVEDCCNDNNFNFLLDMNDPAQVGLNCVPR